jgi:hypothetical protein
MSRYTCEHPGCDKPALFRSAKKRYLHGASDGHTLCQRHYDALLSRTRQHKRRQIMLRHWEEGRAILDAAAEHTGSTFNGLRCPDHIEGARLAPNVAARQIAAVLLQDLQRRSHFEISHFLKRSERSIQRVLTTARRRIEVEPRFREQFTKTQEDAQQRIASLSRADDSADSDAL